MARKPRGVRLAIRKAYRTKAWLHNPDAPNHGDMSGHNVRHDAWATVHPRFKSPLPPVTSKETVSTKAHGKLSKPRVEHNPVDTLANMMLYPFRPAKKRGGFKAWSNRHKAAPVLDANGNVIVPGKAKPPAPVVLIEPTAKEPKAEKLPQRKPTSRLIRSK